ncbi:TPA: hypothetical protein RI793_003474 [Vibrio cholerae]|uniref:ABC-three component system protein n=1 Tax=Vibrio cholerae TaxID=666 RepID=UPI001B83380B|nr:hypothetical protein [Vibrio cholerae]HDV5560840.1 hypothetical protein [Vibrio cholerae]
MPDKNIFDATPSLLGYIFQVRYALLVALDKVKEINDIDDCSITIETVDDISFDDKGKSKELIQTKYHIKPGNVTDKGEDIWHSIRIWAEKFKSDSEFVDNQPILILLTTQSVRKNSLAEMLSADRSKRNEVDAIKRMQEISDTVGNKSNQGAYDTFSSMEYSLQRKLISSIYISSDFAGINSVQELISNHLRICVSKKHIDTFTALVEGYWFQWAIQAMLNNGPNSIMLSDLVQMIEVNSKKFSDTSLPSDYESISIDDFYEREKRKFYINQLSIFSCNELQVNAAIKNCVKAREQRSSWSRNGLLLIGELSTYDEKIYNEWELHAGNVLSMYSSEDSKFKANKIYSDCQSLGLKKIRPDFIGDFVARGTYHLLSDKNKIWWHPEKDSLLEYKEDGDEE